MRTLLLFFCTAPLAVLAQDYVQQRPDSMHYAPPGKQVNMGIGFGFDYGGLGLQLNYLPEKHVALFAAGGYVFVGLGYNVGAVGRILPDRRVCPFVTAMYGYNAFIQVKGADELNRIYYGPSFGAGCEFHKKYTNNYWRVALLIPVRPDAFRDDIDALKHNPSIKIQSEPPGFGISGGYNFWF